MALIYNGSQINSLVWNGTETTGVWNGSVVWKPVTPEPPSFDEVTIGTQTWMAKNLAFDDGGEGITAYNVGVVNGVDLGTQYFYTWAAANRVANAIEGWHLPTTDEWDTLATYVGGTNDAGTKLKSTNGWSNTTTGGNGNGTDDYGFTVLPVGYMNAGTVSNYGKGCTFWTSTELFQEPQYAYGRSFRNTSTKMNSSDNTKTNQCLIRLVKDAT